MRERRRALRISHLERIAHEKFEKHVPHSKNVHKHHAAVDHHEGKHSCDAGHSAAHHCHLDLKHRKENLYDELKALGPI